MHWIVGCISMVIGIFAIILKRYHHLISSDEIEIGIRRRLASSVAFTSRHFCIFKRRCMYEFLRDGFIGLSFSYRAPQIFFDVNQCVNHSQHHLTYRISLFSVFQLHRLGSSTHPISNQFANHDTHQGPQTFPLAPLPPLLLHHRTPCRPNRHRRRRQCPPAPRRTIDHRKYAQGRGRYGPNYCFIGERA